MNIILKMPDHEPAVYHFEEPVRAVELARRFQPSLLYQILLCRIDRVDHNLNVLIDHDCTVELLDMRSPSANMTYQVSLTLLYIKAVHDVMGKDVPVLMCNSLNKGLFTLIRTSGVDEKAVEAIEKRMIELRDQDVPFMEKKVKRAEMLEAADRDQKVLIESAPDLDEARLCAIGDEQDIMYHPVVPSAGYLKWFDLRLYRSGVLMRFPHSHHPDEMPVYEDQKILYEAFSEATRWDHLMQINYAADLNKVILNDEINDVVLMSEALHSQKIALLAQQIKDNGKKIILIAGPSSSGKTTFAKRLCIQLRVLGLKPLYMGIDDYFHERDETPLNATGEKDFESLAAVDVPLFTSHMNMLLEGKKVDLPTYNFLTGKKEYGDRVLSAGKEGLIVIEGIHGLNPELTAGIPDETKFRIYISPLTQLNIDPHNRVPTTDARMLRRIVRDHQFRGYDCAKTISAWAAVRHGEEINIFPFNIHADVFFNSYCLYELPILKKYAEPLLRQITPDQEEYPEARRMLEFLEFFVTMPDDSLIPNNSIVREFIGGSTLAFKKSKL